MTKPVKRQVTQRRYLHRDDVHQEVWDYVHRRTRWQLYARLDMLYYTIQQKLLDG